MSSKLLCVVAGLSLAVGVAGGCAPPAPPPERAVTGRGTDVSRQTSRADLEKTIQTLSARLSTSPYDSASAVGLADALLRQARVTGNAGLAGQAEAALTRVLDHKDDYAAGRMLATVYLSEHRFRDAIQAAERIQRSRPNDAWTFGILGDAHIELGEYPEAFAAFDRMAAIRPDAASYARASYARELQGDLTGAIDLMQRAAEATTPQDPESQAWHHAQMGHLNLELGRVDAAAREYAHANFVFPNHPFAIEGQARVQAARGDLAGALALVRQDLAASPSPAALAFAGDLEQALNRPAEADRDYRLAAAAWRTDMPEPSRLARFLAERGTDPDAAVRAAEAAWADRKDIFTADALAWSSFRAGHLTEAAAAAGQALRTGTKDRVILYHAAEIARASNQPDRARQLAGEAIQPDARFDVIDGPAAAALNETLSAGHPSGTATAVPGRHK